jgi:hypothetical protein
MPLLLLLLLSTSPDDELVAAAQKLTGDIEQVPPMYSALHHNVSLLDAFLDPVTNKPTRVTVQTWQQ